MDYTLSAPCYQQPQRQWNLTEVVTTDPFSPLPNSTTKAVFAYAHPNYNRYERMDYGYDSVTTIQYAMPNNTPYRLLIEDFDNIHFNKLGKKLYECTADAAGNKYMETFYFATMMDRLGHPVADDECPAQVFTAQETEITNYYEAHDFPLITTRIDRVYDLKHNVVRYVSYGDTTHTQEYFVADITYAQDMPHNLIALPIQITVRDFDGDLLQQKDATYDYAGRPLTIRHLVVENHHVYAETLLSYDEYGNIHRIEFPENYRHQRKMWVYDYDAVAHTYPAERWNEFDHHSHTDYDYRFGKPVLIRDICGNEIRYHYDDWGRMDTVIAPYEADAGVPFTWTAEYKLHYLTHDQYTNNALSYATTRHFDMQHPMEPIQVTLLSNGWGKVIQTQKWGEVEGTPQCVVSGKAVDDCFGRTVMTYHPFVIPITPQTAYYDSTLNGTQTEIRYDILDRECEITLPTHETTLLYYDFEHFDGHFCFSTVTRDANDILTQKLTGTRGQLMQTIAPHQAITTFSYNPLGQLLTSTDPDNFTTTYTYDLLGNCIQRTHPDAGTTTYTYDPAGNLVLHANQKLQNIGVSMEYHYTYTLVSLNKC